MIFSIENIKSLLIIAFSVIVVFLLLQNSCGDSSKHYAEDILNYDKQISVLRLRNGRLVETNKTLQLEHGQHFKMIDSLKKELSLKSVDVVVKYTSKYKYDTINHVFREKLPCDTFTDEFTVDSSNIRFDALITNKMLSIRNLQIPNNQTIFIGKKGNGLFKDDSYSVIVNNSNPHIKGDSLEAYAFKPQQKWYNNFTFKISTNLASFILGTVAGFHISK